MKTLPDLTPDCTACAALCCMALAFDAGEDFAIDKPAGLPCPNLHNDFTCRIHDRLEDEGFAGCRGYDCLGAGQRVVAEVFQGQDWRAQPDLTLPMIAAFDAMRAVHRGLELLLAAERLDLPARLEAKRLALLEAHAPAAWTGQALAAYRQGPLAGDLASFLAALREFV